jgi:hypothetical protein
VGLFSQPSYPQTTTVQQQPQLSPQQQNLQNVASNFLAGQVGVPSQAYPGPFTAPLTPAQQTQISNAVALGNQSYVPQQQGLGALGAYAGGAYLPGTGGPGDAFLNAALQGTTNLAEQQFAQGIQAARSPFIQAGQTGFSSPELGALGQASAQFAANLQNQLAQQALGMYTGEQQLQLGAAPQAVQAGGAVQTMAAQQAALPQQLQQAQYNAALQDWLRQLSGAWSATGVPAFSNIAAAYPMTQTSQSQMYGPSPFESIMGGLGGIAGPVLTAGMLGAFGAPWGAALLR